MTALVVVLAVGLVAALAWAAVLSVRLRKATAPVTSHDTPSAQPPGASLPRLVAALDSLSLGVVVADSGETLGFQNRVSTLSTIGAHECHHGVHVVEGVIPRGRNRSPLVSEGLEAIADVHAGAPHMTLDALRGIVVTVNAAHPDLIVLLGDYVIHGIIGGRFIEPEPIATVLGRLSAPLGVLAVTGNHDWWYDGERVRQAFRGAGIPVLENEAAAVGAGGHTVWLVGLADAWTRPVDLDGPLSRVPAGAPVLVLTHNPDVFPMVPGRVGLTVAGHTHGGQVRLPFLGRPVVPSRFGQRYAAGLVSEQGHSLFVTPGVGTSIVPVRFRVPPAVSLLTLRSAASDR